MYRVYCDGALMYDVRYENLKILNAKLELELNKTNSFEFTIYPDHPKYNSLQKLKTIITVYQDEELIFRGRVLNDEQGFYNEKQVTCEGELAFLVDSIQRPYDFLSGDKHTTIDELFKFFIKNHNYQVVDEEHRFKVGNITVTDPNNYIVRADSTYLNTWDSINQKLIETNGGYLWVRHEKDGNYIDYIEDFSYISEQTIEFGENLLDLNKITKGEDIATAIIPLGKKLEESEERITIKSVNGGIDYVYNQAAVDTYGWIFKTQIWDDVTEPINLKTKANEYLSESINLAVSLELTAVDLKSINKSIDSFKLGNYIHVLSRPHNLDTNLLVTKLSIDLLKPAENKLTLGSTYLTFTEQTSSASKSINTLIDKVEQVATTQSETIPISKGGTGATTAENALIALGAVNITDVGDTSTLTTSSQIVVGAINELDAGKENKTTIKVRQSSTYYNESDLEYEITLETATEIYITDKVTGIWTVRFPANVNVGDTCSLYFTCSSTVNPTIILDTDYYKADSMNLGDKVEIKSKYDGSDWITKVSKVSKH